MNKTEKMLELEAAAEEREQGLAGANAELEAAEKKLAGITTKIEKATAEIVRIDSLPKVSSAELLTESNLTRELRQLEETQASAESALNETRAAKRMAEKELQESHRAIQHQVVEDTISEIAAKCDAFDSELRPLLERIAAARRLSGSQSDRFVVSRRERYVEVGGCSTRTTEPERFAHLASAFEGLQEIREDEARAEADKRRIFHRVG
ncbi:MAG: hypothetical protein QM723_05325 [Myxococcaceae bacterium]